MTPRLFVWWVWWKMVGNMRGDAGLEGAEEFHFRCTDCSACWTCRKSCPGAQRHLCGAEDGGGDFVNPSSISVPGQKAQSGFLLFLQVTGSMLQRLDLALSSTWNSLCRNPTFPSGTQVKCSFSKSSGTLMMGTSQSGLLWLPPSLCLCCLASFQVACAYPCPPLCHELLRARTDPSSLCPSWHPPVLA